MAPPPPIPKIIKRYGIPIVGGLGLAGASGCGLLDKGADDAPLGSWNLTQMTYVYANSSYTMSMPQAYSESEGCLYYYAMDLEIDDEQSARAIQRYGYIACSGGTYSSTTQLELEIGGDGTLRFYGAQGGSSIGGSGDVPGVVTDEGPIGDGGLAEAGDTGAEDVGEESGDEAPTNERVLVLTCTQDGNTLNCEGAPDEELPLMTWKRPECEQTSECLDTETCVAAQCVVASMEDDSGSVLTSAGVTGEVGSATGDGFSETGGVDSADESTG